jgi:hypothetical protein
MWGKVSITQAGVIECPGVTVEDSCVTTESSFASLATNSCLAHSFLPSGSARLPRSASASNEGCASAKIVLTTLQTLSV